MKNTMIQGEAFWIQSVSESKTAFLSATTSVGLIAIQSGAGTIRNAFDFFRSTP